MHHIGLTLIRGIRGIAKLSTKIIGQMAGKLLSRVQELLF